MFQQIDDHPNHILKQTQIEALKSISQLLIREINSLDDTERNLTNQIKNGKRICLNNEMQRFEIDLIRRALICTMGKQTEAAKLLGLKRSTLSEKIKRYKIELI